jgi:hypothetical protein
MSAEQSVAFGLIDAVLDKRLAALILPNSRITAIIYSVIQTVII